MTSSQNHFVLPGDSGSLVFSDKGPVGLLHAVNIPKRKSYICKASNIEKLLEVSFVPPVSTNSHAYTFDHKKFPSDPKERFDILIGGISIGHKKVTAGTLGTFVWDKATGELFGLTCAHIAAPSGAVTGDPIYQPGPLDIRTKFHREPTDRDIAGHLVRWIPISFTEPNLIDAALFRPVRPVWPNFVLGYGERPLMKPVL
jgi:hypothetical protein